MAFDQFSDYVVYVDESGDHSLKTIDKEYPVFVLVFCILKISDYLELIKSITALKFKYFGHDKVVFHENDIRRKRGDFKVFTQEYQQAFMTDYWAIVNSTNFTVIASIIDKVQHKERYTTPENPYSLSMKFCLERFNCFLQDNNVNADKITYIVVEQRGKNEDNDLELEFRRICQNNNFNFKLRMANKQTNCAGLQLADLIARPIGLKILKPEQGNRGFDIIKSKLRDSQEGCDNYGLKVFP